MSSKKIDFTGADKVLFDILDNIFKYRFDEIYVQDTDVYKNGYCIRNIDKDENYHFKIDITHTKIKIKTSNKSMGLMFIHSYRNGLGNKTQEELEKQKDVIKEGEIEYKNVSPHLLMYFKDKINMKHEHYKEIQLKEYETSIYKILGINRRVKIKNFIK